MSVLARIDGIGQTPSMQPAERMPIRLVVWMGVLMSFGGVLWTALALAAGHHLAAIVPSSYVVITAINLMILARTHRFAWARRVQVSISLVLPFLFQLALGGVAASGAVMLWALLALVASLAFQSPRGSAVTIGCFVALACVMGLLDASAARWAGSATALDPASRFYLVLNVVAVGTMVGVLTAFLDHLRRGHGNDLQVANGRILALNDALRTEVTRAERAEAAAQAASLAKSSFLANMSHELRTPLNAIIGYAELLEEDGDEAVTRDASQIRVAGRHLLALVNDVLDVAKVEAGKLELELVPIGVGGLVAEVHRTFDPLFAQQGNHFEVDVRDLPDRILGDPLRIQQVLLNVLSNANKFTDQGRVQLSVRHGEERLRIEVRDTGIGMTPGELQRVREPFQQADSSTTRTRGGTGLGLHLVDRLAELMGGRLELSSCRGEGTQVVVTIRAQVPDAAAR